LHRGPPAGLELLVEVLVALLAPDVGLIDLDSSGKHAFPFCESFPDAVVEEPSRTLGNAELSAQLDAGDSLARRSDQIGCQEPCSDRKLAALHRGSDPDAEMLAAVSAIEWHGLDALAAPDIFGVAACALRAFRPALGLEMLDRGFLVRHEIHELCYA